jgi:drug/metabolite transporter (DMT)-like permease
MGRFPGSMAINLTQYNPDSMSRKQLRAYIEVAFAVVVWGASFIFTKIALRDLEPTTVVWLRFTIGIVILGFAAAARRQLVPPKKNEWLYFIVLGILGITFHQWLQSTGLQTVQASTTAWVVATSPIFIAIFSWAFLREKLNWLQVAGILMAALGVLLVVSDGNLGSVFTGQFGTYGDILILISAINWAVFSILSTSGLKRYQPTQMMFFVMGIGWFFTTILFLLGNGVRDILNITWPSFFGVTFLGILCSGLAYIAWYDALYALTATQTGAFLNVEPLVAVLVAWAVLGEKILVITLVGGMIILIGVRLVQKSHSSPAKLPTEV